MSRRLSALLLWSLVAAATVYWSLRLFVRPAPLPTSARLASATPSAAADWSRLLGASPKAIEAGSAQPAPAAAARFRLAGVAAAGSSGASTAAGVALIAVDGKPARAYRVGQRLAGEYVLQSVSVRSATLAVPVAGSLVLEIPAAPPAATALLPMAGAAPPPAPTAVLPAPAFVAPAILPPSAPPPPPPPSGELPAPQADFRGSPLAR